ncbi:nucleotidyltransferase [Peribacillus cavernae]|uniref:tRNA(Met) cytidine acetate ligase n=1 Tax=Peribacillus cavernae TaxID=1674310 RepID=A0A3S0TYH9_9BACI|nr:nucleotidyltransferase [Peribacillus cavernae]MDQ0217190.1 putative nucleotidyltransferase [Peribacillus cavernae]RUQ30339.1 nucleotidyltransferase [Peribacillus cavernae]
MKAVGLVVEYNPFHNGHGFHLKKSKIAADAEIVIAVMSGPFLQRGEPSLISKWARAEMALKAGVDLVFELPYSFAAQKAEIFARGAIMTLEALQCDSFCFGSENGQIEPFLRTYLLLEEHRDHYNELIKEHMKKGYSYPKAASLAFSALSAGNDTLDLSKPNNILGIEYVQAALSNHFAIKPLTIGRIKADYHDTQLTATPIASATAIRKSIFENGESAGGIQGYVPESTISIMKEYVLQYKHLHNWELYWPLLKFRIISASAPELRQIYEIEEGIEHRLQDAAGQSQNFHEFMTAIKTKRYTWTRLQRMCAHILVNTTKAEMIPLQKHPSYIRLLGMSRSGREYLRTVKRKLPLPIVSRLSAFHSKAIKPDIRASRVYALGLPEPYQSRLMKREFEAPFVLEI